MDLITHTKGWVKGEVANGWVLLIIGLALLIGFIAILFNHNQILRGTMLPLSLLILLLIGFGGYQIIKRPSHLTKVEHLYQQNPDKVKQTEYEKAMKDNKVYSFIKIVWVVLVVISLGMYFISGSEYYKGMSIGFSMLFLSTLLIDSILHQRLLNYLEHLKL